MYLHRDFYLKALISQNHIFFGFEVFSSLDFLSKSFETWNIPSLGVIEQPLCGVFRKKNCTFFPKHEAQSSRYSCKQQTLHDTLIRWPDGTYTYLYHLSDDTKHDSVLSSCIL